MTTLHHPNGPEQSPTTLSRVSLARPAQCLRHHKWMAACDDCRDARTADRSRLAARR